MRDNCHSNIIDVDDLFLIDTYLVQSFNKYKKRLKKTTTTTKNPVMLDEF